MLAQRQVRFLQGYFYPGPQRLVDVQVRVNELSPAGQPLLPTQQRSGHGTVLQAGRSRVRNAAR
jgi:hypothetical protein